MPDFTHATSEVAVRFHRESEWYVASRLDELYVLRVQATSERAVELFHRCSAFLDPIVDIVMSHRRDGASWLGPMRMLAETREAIGRLRWPLAAYGGVELTLVTPDDQLTLMPSLELVICSRRDDWRPRLDAQGVHARVTALPACWQSDEVAVPEAPELSAALASFVQRLALVPGS